MIDLEQLERMFAAMRGTARWNVDGPLRWGYVFTDRDPARLARAGQALEALGYRVIEVCPDEDGQTHLLRVERDEHHTPHTLHQRNQELSALAERLGLESYDGMEVGPLGRAIAQA